MHEIVSNCGIIENCEQRANDSITCKVHLCLAFENAREIWSHHYVTKMKSLQIAGVWKGPFNHTSGLQEQCEKGHEMYFLPYTDFLNLWGIFFMSWCSCSISPWRRPNLHHHQTAVLQSCAFRNLVDFCSALGRSTVLCISMMAIITIQWGTRCSWPLKPKNRREKYERWTTRETKFQFLIILVFMFEWGHVGSSESKPK